MMPAGFQQGCPAQKSRPPSCATIDEGDYYEYTNYDGSDEDEDEETSEFKQWKTWRDRAALAAPTDFLKATLFNDIVKIYHQQSGPECGAMAVANVLNGLMKHWYVESMDVFDYLTVKANTERDKRFGEGRKIYSSTNRLTTKFTSNKCLVNAFVNLRKTKPYTALAYDKANSGPQPKEWYVLAQQNKQANFVLSKVTAKVLVRQGETNGLRFHVNPGQNMKAKDKWRTDNAATVDKEWECLKVWLEHCRTGACGMIFHLPNHWAPIYGYRELKGRRQLLVPSAGQTPAFWQDYRTVRETLEAARGYNIFVAYTTSPQIPTGMKCR